jgi:hypothetical protein
LRLASFKTQLPQRFNSIWGSRVYKLEAPVLGVYEGSIYEDVEHIRGLFSNLESISLPDWWPGVAGLNGRCLDSWPSLKTLAVGTVQPAAVILTEIENGRGMTLLMQGMLFAECRNPQTYVPKVPHVRHCLTFIQHPAFGSRNGGPQWSDHGPRL